MINTQHPGDIFLFLSFFWFPFFFLVVLRGTTQIIARVHVKPEKGSPSHDTMRSQVLSPFAIAAAAVAGVGPALAQEESTMYTATATASVYAAQATAETSSPVSYVKGKAFDRLAIIWLENTDYELAVNDRESFSSLI